MVSLKDKTVADIVTGNIKTAHVFKRHGIDFCCGGGISVAKACEKVNIEFAALEKELQNVDHLVTQEYDYNSWELDFLTEHIIKVHHRYVLEAIPLILQYSGKVTKVHGAHYAELVKIDQLFQDVANELRSHLRKEEVVLFPYIVELVKAERENRPAAPPAFGTVNNPIRMMSMEHENAGDIFKSIAALSDNYTPPPGACNTFRALYSKLNEFEQDLHHHIHLENNILFPKAMELEQSIMR